MRTKPASGLRVLFVSPDEPFLMPLFYDRLFARIQDEPVALALVRPIYKGSGWIGQARRFIAAFGVRAFVTEAVRFAGARGVDAYVRVSGRPSSRTVRGVAKAHAVPLLEADDVNGVAFVSAVEDLDPDLIVSVSCPQIFGLDLLKTPRLGCINVHSALLPRHRGMLPTFWALAEGDAETGVTVHTMAEAIDQGEIVAQAPVQIRPEETLHSLMIACKLAAADLVLATLDAYRLGTVETKPPEGGGEYHSFPTAADVARFRARGRRLR